MIDLRLGSYLETLDVEVDTTITDPPYGSKTHDGHAARTRTDIRNGRKMPAPLEYDGWSDKDVIEFVNFMAPRTRGWLVAMTSHDLFPTYAAALERNDRYVFAPI
ncbi:hypothetical protein LCGC14_2819490, partial [marine sediment metagenome]